MSRDMVSFYGDDDGDGDGVGENGADDKGEDNPSGQQMLADSSAVHEVVAGDANIEQNLKAAAGSTESRQALPVRATGVAKACRLTSMLNSSSFFGCY